MPREFVLFGFFVPTLLPLFVAAFALQWLVDSALGRLGFFSYVWHPALFRLSLLVCAFGASGLAVYR